MGTNATFASATFPLISGIRNTPLRTLFSLFQMKDGAYLERPFQDP